MSKIQELFKRYKTDGKKAFIPYITAGDPCLSATEDFVKSLVRAGADIIELGVPFSDPVADGEVNQRAAMRALKGGTSLRGVLDLIKLIRNEGIDIPIVLFTYFNPIFRLGLEQFASLAAESGVNGALVVDLPVEESGDFLVQLSRFDLDSIFLASPTTSSERLQVIERVSTGFVYYVSRTGVTGVRENLSETLESELKLVRKSISKPLAVGFGISTAEQARRVAHLSDAVVVGSSLVQVIEESSSIKEADRNIFLKATELANSIHGIKKQGELIC